MTINVYFKDWHNWVDWIYLALQIAFTVKLLVIDSDSQIKLPYDLEEDENLDEETSTDIGENGILLTLLIALWLLKVMQVIKVFQQFGTVVRLVEDVFVYTWPFLCFFMLVTFLFSLTNRVLGVSTYASSEDNDYEDMNIFFAYFLMSFRNSLGDLSPPVSLFWQN